jgi:hypothetical protein
MSTRLHVEANSVLVTTPLASCTGPYLYQIKRMFVQLQVPITEPAVHLSLRTTLTITEQRAASHDFRAHSQANIAHIMFGKTHTICATLHFLCFELHPSTINNFLQG